MVVARRSATRVAGSRRGFFVFVGSAMSRSVLRAFGVGTLFLAMLAFGVATSHAQEAGHDDAHPPAAGAAAKDVHHGAADDHGDGEHHEEGLPANWQRDLALWSLVTFLLFFFILSKFAWGPLKTALDQREACIRKEIADAEAANAKAAVLLREHEAKLMAVQEEVKAILAEARRDAEHTKQDIVATAQREAEATRQRAVEDINRAKNVAIAELFDFVSNNVVQATEQVLQRSLTGDDQERLVTQALAEMNLRRN
jgi:F-type H+-transporting ATPase subunit b